MQGIKFDQIESDTVIKEIGRLFRRVDGNQWGISLGFSPDQSKKALRVSNLPVLARRRVLNPSQEVKQAGYKKEFSISDTSNWRVVSIADCPLWKKTGFYEKGQLCFVFQAKTGLTVFLPQLELARSLFLHDGYLSRTALEPDCLKAEFEIFHEVEDDKVTVNVMPSSGYPLKSFNDPEIRRVLSWILVDPEARSSFESIGISQKLNGYEANGYRFWDFQFKPPLLPSAHFEVRGQYNHDFKMIFVYEIKAIRNIKAEMPELIDFYHPRFEEAIRSSGSAPSSVRREKAEVVTLQEQEPNSDGERNMLQAPHVEFEFSSDFTTKKVARKKRHSPVGQKTDGEELSGEMDASVEESTSAGVLRGADWDTVSDVTDDAHLYLDKFSAFMEMLEVLNADYGCKVFKPEIRKLPALERCTKHLMKPEYTPRCWAIGTVLYEGQHFHILEVDTSDAAKALSTQLLRLKSPAEWNLPVIREIEQSLLRQSLRWPTGIFKRITGENGSKGIPHPQTKGEVNGGLTPESIKVWAKRVHRWMTVSAH